jgi:hypothetical protein
LWEITTKSGPEPRFASEVSFDDELLELCSNGDAFQPLLGALFRWKFDRHLSGRDISMYYLSK